MTAQTWWIWVGLQCVITVGVVNGINSEAGCLCRWGGHAEGLRRRRGDAAGVELGGSLADRVVVNVGSVVMPPVLSGSQPEGGQVRRRLMASGRGGVPVVVRACERHVHGEGGQQVGSEGTGRPGGYRR